MREETWEIGGGGEGQRGLGEPSYWVFKLGSISLVKLRCPCPGSSEFPSFLCKKKLLRKDLSKPKQINKSCSFPINIKK
jgi:hypothetical protein